MHKKICLYCGVEFEAIRSDAKFHTATCRVAWNNLPERVAEKIDQAIADIDYLQNMVERFPHLKPVLDEQLVRLTESVAGLIAKLGEE